MRDAGFEIGSHTRSHPRLAEIPLEDSWLEINGSREALESRLKRPVTSFCYPSDNLNEAVIEQVERAGYRRAVVTPPRGGISKGPLTLRRVGIYQKNGPAMFRLKTTSWFRRYYDHVQAIRRGIRGLIVGQNNVGSKRVD